VDPRDEARPQATDSSSDVLKGTFSLVMAPTLSAWRRPHLVQRTNHLGNFLGNNCRRLLPKTAVHARSVGRETAVQSTCDRQDRGLGKDS
jgi:hypothetical protein